MAGNPILTYLPLNGTLAGTDRNGTFTVKRCPVCQTFFERKPKESREQFARKLTCSPECRVALRKSDGIRRRGNDAKACVICGDRFTRRPREGFEKFDERTTCGDACGRKAAGLSLAVPWRARFWSKVAVGNADECWEWQSATSRDGYGRFKCDDAKVSGRAHRAAWVYHNGPIPDGQLVRHLCNNKQCCNPAHLALGTVADNMQDRLLSGGYATQRKGEETPNAKLTSAMVRVARMRHESGDAVADLARAYGVNYKTMSDALAAKTWKHVSGGANI